MTTDARYALAYARSYARRSLIYLESTEEALRIAGDETIWPPVVTIQAEIRDVVAKIDEQLKEEK